MKTLYSHVCASCNKVFESSIKKIKFCSPECYQASRRKRAPKEYMCYCVMCEKPFMADDPDYLFCSDECRCRRGATSMLWKPREGKKYEK